MSKNIVVAMVGWRGQWPKLNTHTHTDRHIRKRFPFSWVDLASTRESLKAGNRDTAKKTFNVTETPREVFAHQYGYRFWKSDQFVQSELQRLINGWPTAIFQCFLKCKTAMEDAGFQPGDHIQRRRFGASAVHRRRFLFQVEVAIKIVIPSCTIT